jgi:hypothetical protein
LEVIRENYPSEVEEIRRSLYFNDIIPSGETRDGAHQLKGTVNEIFGQAKFDLHKWHSKVSELEENDERTPTVQSYICKRSTWGETM